MSRFIAFIIFLLTFPLYPAIFLGIKLSSSGPFIFCQKRMGKNKKIFTIYKFRTMVNNAEEMILKLGRLNEAHGPVFKIKDDPRYTKFGKVLARTALDELPQLINIIKGEMAFVGPRPLPVAEAKQIPAKYEKRFSVLPGLTSPWVISGGHKLSFDQWMKLDVEYTKDKNLWLNISIISKTMLLLLKSVINL